MAYQDTDSSIDYQYQWLIQCACIVSAVHIFGTDIISSIVLVVNISVVLSGTGNQSNTTSPKLKQELATISYRIQSIPITVVNRAISYW